jgi:hypothetical protein
VRSALVDISMGCGVEGMLKMYRVIKPFDVKASFSQIKDLTCWAMRWFTVCLIRDVGEKARYWQAACHAST